jgi:23S rRNA (uridine2552-2'-O)-methyltransferase
MKKKVPGRRGKQKRRTSREATERVKTAKGRKPSSTRWLQRQLNDPYVHEAERLGYRSRAVFKLLEIDEKFEVLKNSKTVVDLGAAPGGWSQLAVEKGAKKVIALDLLPMESIPGVTCLELDFMEYEALDELLKLVPDGADLVMSDLAPNTVGHKQTDHLRIMGMVEAAYDFAIQVLNEDGIFLAKVWQGGAQSDLLAKMKKEFRSVKHVKPPSSRKDSAEQFVVAKGFKKPS